MRFTRARDLFAIALFMGLITHATLLLAYSQLPPIPRLAGATFAVLAVIEAIVASQLRARINRKPGTRPVNVLMAARALALAKASSIVGSAVAGAWIGMIIYVAPQASMVSAANADLVTAVIGAVSATALIAAGLWLEFCCRTPDQPEDRHSA